jgi:hypothetical protein
MHRNRNPNPRWLNPFGKENASEPAAADMASWTAAPRATSSLFYYSRCVDYDYKNSGGIAADLWLNRFEIPPFSALGCGIHASIVGPPKRPDGSIKTFQVIS